MMAQDTIQPEFKTLVAGVLGDIRTLIRQEVTLAQHEVRHEFDKLLRVVVWFVIAMVLAVIGLLAISAACVLILFEYTGLPAWACAAIVSLILLGGAAWLVSAGLSVVKTIHLVPLRTVRTLKDDVKWMVEWMRAKFMST
jgi:uncharacterized membrane protein YqjE